MSGGARLISFWGQSRKAFAEELEPDLDRFKLGDMQAFPRIYERYAGKIYSFVWRMLASHEDAEDITQETFLIVFRNLKHLRQNSHFKSWLYRIARNEVYKRRRRDKPKASSLDDEEKGMTQFLESTDLAANPEATILAGELGHKVRAVLDTLPIKYKEALILATLQNLSYQEISHIVGRSVSSVKTDVYRARLMISQRLQGYLGGQKRRGQVVS